VAPADRTTSAGQTGLVGTEGPGDAVGSDGSVPEDKGVELVAVAAISRSGETDEPPLAQMLLADGIPLQP
jgi:hypothetical protein